MTLIIGLVFWIITIILIALAALFLTQVLMASFGKEPADLPEADCARFVVLMPAHNEAAGIEPVIQNVMKQLRPNDMLLVVADNCTDDTFAIASRLGATVIERTDLVLRGKGYALDFGVKYLSSNPPDVVIVVDADCQVSEHGLITLARQAAACGRPIQAKYLMLAAQPASPRLRFAQFAWLLKNYIRPLGAKKLGLPCTLHGTGMAFPWAVISSADLASGHVVEDLKLGIDLAVKQLASVFSHQVEVISLFPIDIDTQAGQRKRWIHGHIGVILREVPHLLSQAWKQKSTALLIFALDCAIPPMTLFLFLCAGWIFIGGATLAYAMGTRSSYFVCSLFACFLPFVLLSVGIISAWYQHARATFGWQDALRVPDFLIGRMATVFTFVTRRQKAWNKTDRK